MSFRLRMSPITFTDEDFRGVDPSQDDPMVVSVDIDRFTIMKTWIDQGSSVDILYWKTFKQMRIPEAEMTPYDDHVVNFSGERVSTRGYIELYYLQQGKDKQNIQDSIICDRHQHLIQHPVGTTVH